MCSCAFDGIPLVEIDYYGVFKYLLLRVWDYDKRGNKEGITIVRGYTRHDYHSQIFDEVEAKLKPLHLEPLGGGRLVIKPHKKTIELYGYSLGFGKADHEEAARLIQYAYPDYTITTPPPVTDSILSGSCIEDTDSQNIDDYVKAFESKTTTSRNVI